MKQPIIVIAATSGIGRAIARALARQGHPLILTGRDGTTTERLAADCRTRFSVPATALVLDVLDAEARQCFLQRVKAMAPEGFKGLVTCQGVMPDQSKMIEDTEAFQQLVDVNFASVVTLFEAAARALTETGGGFLCAITSVAADRGRPRHHLYGSTKAALTTYLEGLRVRLAPDDIHVINIKPGIVDTAMTWGMSGLVPMASPDRVAHDTLNAIAKNRPVAYSPPFFSIVMRLVRAIPDKVFTRLDF
ncbi:MAG: SDR family NAD(P)-dependent oxidoreductase [Myxococcota bacterium]|nr:SDR family NAD(P)-dependent oxidoreductase [Myxococcota bacterium]